LTDHTRGDRVDDAVASLFPRAADEGRAETDPDGPIADSFVSGHLDETAESATADPDGYPAGDVQPPAPRAPLDGVAVAALITAVLGLSLVAIGLGHWSLARTRARELRGAATARWALVLGYAGAVIAVALWSVYFGVLAPEIALPR
jgi:hypothetical protein